jgi:predicted ATPase
MISGPNTTFLTRVALRNYRSIEGCDVTLGPLTFLVGPNGAGKSNFVDALRLTADALRDSLEHALRDRGGIEEVRRRSRTRPRHFGIHLEFRLPEGSGSYSFRIGARAQGGYEVQAEKCSLPGAQFRVVTGRVVHPLDKTMPPAAADRLYLVNAAGLSAFRPVYDALSRMGFYNLIPEKIRALQPSSSGELLARDGGNIASVLGRLGRNGKGGKARIQEYLSKVVPGIEGVDARPIANMEALEFHQRGEGKPFPATSMSDGTLRALGVLVALFQHSEEQQVPLVAIEEPEVALHPAAAGVLLDSLRDASSRTQILVTSHSPELLDTSDLGTDSILAVTADEGSTNIGHIDESGRNALHDRLFTAGELLKLGQLRPDMNEASRGRDLQLEMFGGGDD